MGSDAVSAEEAFRLLGEETRMAILRAVWESPDGPVPFSEIRERVGNPDSGKFNYHLNKLRGHFLSAGEDGYRLTGAGREVVRAVLAGTVTRRPSTEPAPIDARCADCGGELLARYDDHVAIACGDCGATAMWNEFPPAGLDGRTPPAVATAFDRWTRHRFRLAMDGVCPNCAAAVTTALPDPGADERPATDHRCTNCGYEARVPLFGHVLDHPAVVSFYHEAGVDVAALPYWRLQALAGEIAEEVVDEDPWRAAVTIESEGRTLAVTLDGDLDAVAVDRSDR